MEEENGILSIGDFFRVIFNRKWIVLAVTLVALLVGTLVVHFVINRSQTLYQVYFTTEYPGKGSVYPDGKVFSFQDMVSVEYMQEVKASNEKFAKIDVELISKNDGIAIYPTALTEGTVKDQPDLSSNEKLYEYRFVAKAKYFPDENTANMFLRALASYPSEYNKTAIEKVDFNKNLLAYDSPAIRRYEEKLNIINNHFDFLTTQYSDLISTYGSSLVLSIGEGEANTKSLSGWMSELDAAYGSYDRQSLSTVLTRYGYSFDDAVYAETNDDLVYELQENYNKIENNKKLLASVDNSGTTSEATIIMTISNLETRNASIEHILEYRGVDVDKSTAAWTWKLKADPTAYNKYKSESQAFGVKLDSIKAVLEEQALQCQKVVTAAYDQQARVIFSNNKLEDFGGQSLIIGAVSSMLIGLILVVLVVLIVDMPAYARKKREALYGLSADAPVEIDNEQLAEAAPSQTEESNDKK